MDEQFAYRTGRTDPAKSSRGIIAALLALVIFLGGLVSILGIMNIHLFRKLQDTQEKPLSFARGEAAQTEEDCLVLAGMALREPDPVYQELHQLPEGLFVAQVEPGSPAEKLHIQPGDVLILLNKTPVTTLSAAEELLAGKKTCRILLWRAGREIDLNISQ